MARYYSRLKSIENKRRTKKAFLMLVVTVGVIAISIFAGFKILSMIFLFISGMNLNNQVAIKDDLIPPSPPRISLPYEATNSSQITITGRAEPRATIYITQNEKPLGNVVVDDQGTFLLTGVKLNEGYNLIDAIAMDEAGNKSQGSTQVNIYYSSKLPNLEISSPSNNQQIRGGDPRIEIKGETDPENRVTINDRVVIVNASGSFNHVYNLVPGENIVRVSAFSRAGNQKTEELKITYSAD